MFVPLVMIGSVPDLESAIGETNETVYGLTGGFFGTVEEAQWYFDRIKVGTAYANRSQGASTGAWPGYQDFGASLQRGGSMCCLACDSGGYGSARDSRCDGDRCGHHRRVLRLPSGRAW